MSSLAVAAPNEAAADAAEQVALAGGNAVDAALAAALVAMVNEVGIVSLSSGGFVTVQPGGDRPAYAVDGWMDMPGRGRAPTRRPRFHVGRVDGVWRRRRHDHRPRLGRRARLAGGVRRGPPARRTAAVARDRRAGGRGGPRRLPADLGGSVLPRLHPRRDLRLGRGEPGGPPRCRGRAHHGPDRDARPRRIARADRRRRTRRAPPRRAGRADQPRRDRARWPAHAGRPRGVRARRPAGAGVAGRRLDAVHDATAALGRRRLPGRDAPPPARPPGGEPARPRPRRPGPAGRARTPARRAGPRPRPGGGGRRVPRARRPRPPRRPRVGLDRPRVGDRPLRYGVRRHVLLGLRLRDDRGRHRHLAQQLPR